MTEDELKRRLGLAHLAIEANGPTQPESIPPKVIHAHSGPRIHHDFRGEDSEEECYLAIMSVVDMIVGLRDRTKGWLKRNGLDSRIVDEFIETHDQVAIVHDLANLNKHGSVGRKPLCGKQIELKDVGRAMVLKYDPVSGKFATKGEFIGQAFNARTGEISGDATSTNVEVTLVANIVDQDGNLISQIPKALPQAIYDWEQFLLSLGLQVGSGGI